MLRQSVAALTMLLARVYRQRRIQPPAGLVKLTWAALQREWGTPRAGMFSNIEKRRAYADCRAGS